MTLTSDTLTGLQVSSKQNDLATSSSPKQLAQTPPWGSGESHGAGQGEDVAELGMETRSPGSSAQSLPVLPHPCRDGIGRHPRSRLADLRGLNGERSLQPFPLRAEWVRGWSHKPFSWQTWWDKQLLAGWRRQNVGGGCHRWVA